MNYPQEKSAPTARDSGGATNGTSDKNAKTNLPTDATKRNRALLPGDPAWDQADAALQFVWLVQRISKERLEGFYHFDAFQTPARSMALVRWIQRGFEETVCLVDYDAERVLFTEDQHDSHEHISDAAIAVGWDSHVVDSIIAPTCPSCGGACFIRDCEINQRCELCEGSGRLGQ